MITNGSSVITAKPINSPFKAIPGPDAEVMPVQIDYEKRRFTLLPALDIEGTEEEVISRLRSLFDGIKGKHSRFEA